MFICNIFFDWIYYHTNSKSRCGVTILLQKYTIAFLFFATAPVSVLISASFLPKPLQTHTTLKRFRAN